MLHCEISHWKLNQAQDTIKEQNLLKTFFFKEFIFIFWLCWVLVVACGIFCCSAWAPLVVACGFSLLYLWHAGSRVRGLCSLWCAGSVVVARGLSCPTLCGILVPWPGIKPASPALEGGFFTTEQPGKSQNLLKILNLTTRLVYICLPCFQKQIKWWK